MTRSSVVRRSREGASAEQARTLRTTVATEGRSGSVNRPKTDKG
jgi:hypothetical protein